MPNDYYNTGVNCGLKLSNKFKEKAVNDIRSY